MSFKSDDDQDVPVDPDEDSGYQFDITVYSNENLDRITELIRNKGRGHIWDFFDPEDLANKALRKLWKYTILHPDCCRGVSESTIDREIVSIKKKIVLSLTKISNVSVQQQHGGRGAGRSDRRRFCSAVPEKAKATWVCKRCLGDVGLLAIALPAMRYRDSSL